MVRYEYEDTEEFLAALKDVGAKKLGFSFSITQDQTNPFKYSAKVLLTSENKGEHSVHQALLYEDLIVIAEKQDQFNKEVETRRSALIKKIQEICPQCRIFLGRILV